MSGASIKSIFAQGRGQGIEVNSLERISLKSEALVKVTKSGRGRESVSEALYLPNLKKSLIHGDEKEGN